MTEQPAEASEAVVSDIPLAFYQWRAGIERDTRLWELTPHEIKALLATLRPAIIAEQIEQWRPIADAPLDRVILVGAWVDGDDCPRGSADIWSQWFTEYSPGSAWPWGCDGTNGDEPTHYREAPEPPAAIRQQKGPSRG